MVHKTGLGSITKRHHQIARMRSQRVAKEHKKFFGQCHTRRALIPSSSRVKQHERSQQKRLVLFINLFSPLRLLITTPSNNIRRLYSNCKQFICNSQNLLLYLGVCSSKHEYNLETSACSTNSRRKTFLVSFYRKFEQGFIETQHPVCVQCWHTCKHGLLRLLPTSFIFMELTVAERMCKHNDKAFLQTSHLLESNILRKTRLSRS